ncbi:MAG: hypothetical protein R3C18_07790 [Planctomycetaceae bacterium]
MLSCEYELLEEVPNWRAVLSTYIDLLEEDTSQPLEETDGGETDEPTVSRGPRYIPRLHQVDGVTSEELSPIHGRLIALGWLQFQVESKDVGLTYRVTAEGRKALSQSELELATTESQS